METTKELDLQITTKDTLGEDHPNDTIVAYGENFQKLEDAIGISATSVNNIETNKIYSQGQIIWNSRPVLGGFVGWVNIRDGLHVNPVKANHSYEVGDKVSAMKDTGFYYECIRKGTTPNKMQPMSAGSIEFDDVSSTERWGSEKNYIVDDIIFGTAYDRTFYLMCTKAGKVSATEPVWEDYSINSTIQDGSVTWKKLANIRWKRQSANARFTPFGKIGEE